MSSIPSRYKAFLQNCHEKNLRRTLVQSEPLPGGRIKVGQSTYLNLSSNDYLGLNHHPDLIEASKTQADRYGAGMGASRLVTGNLSLFGEIEQKIAALKGTEAALIFASGFQANGTILQALFDKKVLNSAPFILADKLNHASMHFGCMASGVRQHRYRHLEIEHAQTLLKEAAPEHPKFCLTETVFSMDGDVAPMADLSTLCQATDTLLIADDAHGFGVLGEKGKGLGEGADIIIGTFSKALGSFGAYVAASQIIIDYLIQKCSGLIYSTALPPTTLGAIDAALNLLPSLNKERETVANNAKMFRSAMQTLGLNTGASTTQIVPLIVGDEGAALALSETLRQNGIWVTAIRPPTVPKGTARLRFAFSANHSKDDIEHVIKIITTHVKKHPKTS